jgi:catabolite repression protein CreC
LDVIIGFSSGDIIWFDPISNKYARLNKNVKATLTRPISHHSHYLSSFPFLEARNHNDANSYPIFAQGMINSHAVTEIKWLPGSENLFLAAHQDGSLIVYDKERDDAPFMPEDAPDLAGIVAKEAVASDTVADLMKYFSVKKSVHSKNQRANPVSYWSVSRSAITAFAFSPDCEHVAVVSEDQCLRTINFLKEK